MIELDSVVKEFLVESYENLDQLDRDLVALEKDPQNRDRLSSVFRTIHTIKGTCGFFGFSKLESVTHVGESLLSRLRDGLLLLDPERTSALLALLDAVRVMLANIENTGGDGDGDYRELIDRLTRLQEAQQASPASPAIEASSPAVVLPEAPQSLGEALVRAGKAEPEEILDAVQQQIDGDPLRVGEILVEKGIVQTQDIREAVTTLQESKGVAVADTSIRVDVSLLDKLMNLVGELVLARNQILQFNATQKDTTFLSTTQRLNLITTELQEGVMKTRMQPIGNIWNRFPRVVRDLAVTCGKEVRLEMEGKETELDKTIIEAIKDPLTHIVRNSVDHGIEKSDTRVARGKPAAGTLLLRAFHEGGQVNIEIIDDGAGVNTERVKAKALERGLINHEQAARMTDREATHLLFLPGFSTAEKVTNVSGRGVGMDVVKTNIEKIGGTVDLQSQPGKGTTLKIKIPLTLAIIPALIVTSSGDRFAIPQVSLLELVRLEGELARKGIERIHGAPVYRLRGNLLPLVYLNHELGNEGTANSAANDTINIVVLRADDRQFGLVVEGINDTEEIVVKPLGKLLKGIPVFAGATIMGDGRVALILDVLGIAQQSGVVSGVRDRTLADLAERSTDQKSDSQTLLLLGVGKDRRAAIPLSMVARLEEIPNSDIEMADSQEVVQYRGQILPLIRLSGVLAAEGSDNHGDLMQVVVYSDHGRSVGLVVDRILDIVETSLEVQRATRREGIIASAVIQQRVTDLLDVHGIIRGVDPSFFEAAVAV
ncbi:MAG TPA: chemotaxis protein CheA [Gemmataceae bacterium]|nr:chemotaxis protein CheA [Gemmataceae bacterium]